MVPYYSDELVTIYHADCRDVLPTLEAGSVDLVLTDPPFGLGLENHGWMANKRGGRRSWTLETDNFDAIQEIIDSSPLSDLPLCVFASPFKPFKGDWRNLLVWDKGPAVGWGGDPSLCWKRTWELIQIRRNRTLNGVRDGSVLKFWSNPVQMLTDHVCEKPVGLLVYLIERLSQVGDSVLDPFLGSGTTAVAAKMLNRRCIGVEIEERYCEIAADRCRQTVMQFDAPTPQPTQLALEAR